MQAIPRDRGFLLSASPSCEPTNDPQDDPGRGRRLVVQLSRRDAHQRPANQLLGAFHECNAMAAAEMAARFLSAGQWSLPAPEPDLTSAFLPFVARTARG